MQSNQPTGVENSPKLKAVGLTELAQRTCINYDNVS